jgi:hypothetical protein
VKNLQVTLIALLVWTAASAALVVWLPLERAMPFLLLGLCLVPVAVFMAERFRGTAPAAPTSTVAPVSPAPVEAPTEENLRRVFGEDGVAPAWVPRWGAVPAPVDALERLGGPPAFLAPVEWPRCQHCGQPLTFIA